MSTYDIASQRDLINQPLTTDEFEQAAAWVGGTLLPTAQIQWPLLSARLGCEVWVKHENHLPTGAFKVRGGLWFMQQLQASGHHCEGVIAATRGNHGQSIAFAARRQGVAAVIVVPRGNNPDKNRAMRALGAELIEAGEDFDAALSISRGIAQERNLMPLPSFHPWLVQGVGTYAYELFQAAPPLDAVFVPIGLGSGICGVIAARDALQLNCAVIGVVSDHADGYATSFEAGRVIGTDTADTLADGLAVRNPDAQALSYIAAHAEDVVRVSDEQVLTAIRAFFEDTHNLAEGAGAAPLAALMAAAPRYANKRVGVILSGGNLDRAVLLRALETAP